MNSMDRMMNEIMYKNVQKRLERIGFYRVHDDTDGKKLSGIVKGVAMLSETTNLSGHQLLVLVTHREGDNAIVVRVVGYDVENSEFKRASVNGLYHDVGSSEKVAGIVADAVRHFAQSESGDVFYDLLFQSS